MAPGAIPASPGGGDGPDPVVAEGSGDHVAADPGPLRAVLFDVDDTLLDTRAAMLTASRAAVAAAWPHLDEQTVEAIAAHHRDDRDGWFPRYTSGELTLEQMRRARLAAAAREHGLPEEEATQLAFEEAYAPGFFAATRVFDEVPGVLANLTERGLAVGLLTNAAQTFTTRKLEVAALAVEFGCTITRDTLGYGKPDPRVFAHACELLGSTPGTTVYVGDELTVDAIGARDAGLCGVWLDRRGRWGGEDVGVPVIRTLAELDRVLSDPPDGFGARPGSL